jgi:single-strand DNA-binding protein
MANLNKVMLIGRLTRDPETRSFANGGKVAKFGFAVNFRPAKKNPTTGEWDQETVFVDVEVFNSERRQLADLVENSLRKGQQVYLEGRLRLNEWTDKEGQKRSKLLVVADTLEFLEPRAGGGGDGSGSRFQRPAAMAATPGGSRASLEQEYEDSAPIHEPPPPERSEGDIPF